MQRDPKKLVVYFSGLRGRKLRENFLAMKTDVSQEIGSKLEKCIIDGLASTSTSYTFQDPRGLLYSTQFAQPALVLMQLAVFADIKSKGLIQSDSSFAGHSLGEYAALGALSGFMSLESLLDLVFYRGLAMQASMERDEDGQTDFSMIAVNPSRIVRGKVSIFKSSPSCTEFVSGFRLEDFETIVGIISEEMQLLLEVVNYNVEDQQYVCAGHVSIRLLCYFCNPLIGCTAPRPVGNDSSIQRSLQDAATRYSGLRTQSSPRTPVSPRITNSA